MAIIKCKMCGGDLNIAENNSVAVCEYCGTQQTVPSADNEKKLTLFGRANRLRMACEFDKAAGVYESIVVDFPEEAEAYWGLVLCKYGIEYVDDPATGKKIPTCHRSSFDSVMDDSNLEQALENADAIARRVYRDEAKAIEDLRKGIIEVSGKEEPYDIFICYKETDDNGDRTIDSVIAQEVYDALTEKGYRVFFSRITLEDKLGQEYEPYIFAALHSAKIMLAFGTDYEYYNAVWVKNEWSRFLQLIAAGEKKTLIPCFKNIDAYDMPKEFARLQAQDMGKVGAMQDLLRGIEKILPREKQVVKETVVVQQPQNNATASLLKRAFMFLEDRDWESAEEYCEKVLDIDPECADAYLGKLMAELKLYERAELKNCAKPFDGNSNYKKVIRFADDKLKNEINGYIDYINARIAEQARKAAEQARIEEEKRKAEAEACREASYQQFAENARNAKDIDDLKKTVAMLRELGNYKDSQELIALCNKQIKEMEKEQARIKAERARIEAERARENLSRVRNKISPVAGVIAAGEGHSLGMKTDGTVVSCGWNQDGQCKVGAWRDIVAISAGGAHSLGLKTDGTMVACGENDFGQCNVSAWRDVVAIAAGGNHSIGLKADGTVVACGDNQLGQCNVGVWRDIVAIAAGFDHSLGLKVDGTVVACGWNKEGRCNVDTWRDIVAISAGGAHSLGIKSNGKVVACGWNQDGECNVGAWRDIVAIAAGFAYSLGIKSNGTVVACGDNQLGQCNVGAWRDIVAIATGANHSLGLKSNGTVIACGGNDYGKCDVGQWRLFNNYQYYTEERKKADNRKQGVCQHCGGAFKGLLSKKCISCGKDKDY